MDYTFLFYYLKSFYQKLRNLTGDNERSGLSMRVLRPLPVVVPPIDIQNKIVNKLEEQMAQIERIKKEAEKEFEATSNLFKSCLISFFKNIDGKDSLIRDLITYHQSGFACAISTLVTSGGYAHLRPFNIGDDGKFNMNIIYQVPLHMVDGKKYYLSKGDILFNNTNSIELVGKSVLVDNDYPYAFSNHINKIKVKETLIKPEFFQYNLMYLWLTNYFANNCKKWIGQAGFTVNKLKELLIKVPSYEEQERIVNILRNKSNIVEQNKIYLQIQLNAINQLPNSILNEVFGQYQIQLS